MRYLQDISRLLPSRRGREWSWYASLSRLLPQTNRGDERNIKEEKGTPMQDLLISVLSHYGLREVDGLASNPEIIAMAQDLGYEIKDDSTTAWCSLAINYFAKKCGYEYTGKLDARSWLKMPIMVLKPTMGDLVILWRNDPKGWEGHVGIFIAWDDSHIYVLGGNQSNAINIIPYPRERLLGFRQLKKVQP